MEIGSLSLSLPCNCKNAEEREPFFSLAIRVTAFFLGFVAVFFALIGFSSAHYVISSLVSWSLMGAGIPLGLLSTCLKWVTKPKPLLKDPERVEIAENIAVPEPRSFVEIVDINRCDDVISSEPQPYSIAQEDGFCFFQLEWLSFEMFFAIASYLPVKKQIEAMEVSKDFCCVMRSKYIWKPYLELPDYRLWGATRWNEAFFKGSYLFEDQVTHREPFLQLKSYHTQRARGELESFFDYLARLMPGGPLAFAAIPQVNVANVNALQEVDMMAPIVRGQDGWGHAFLALHLVDKADQSVLLIFLQSGTLWHWDQIENCYWKRNELNLNCQDVCNYVLALVSSHSQEEADLPPTWKKPLRLKSYKEVKVISAEGNSL